MNKENTKMINATVSIDCWKELNILRYRKSYNNLSEVVKDILESYTNKIISRDNKDNNSL